MYCYTYPLLRRLFVLFCQLNFNAELGWSVRLSIVHIALLFDWHLIWVEQIKSKFYFSLKNNRYFFSFIHNKKKGIQFFGMSWSSLSHWYFYAFNGIMWTEENITISYLNVRSSIQFNSIETVLQCIFWSLVWIYPYKWSGDVDFFALLSHVPRCSYSIQSY